MGLPGLSAAQRLEIAAELTSCGDLQSATHLVGDDPPALERLRAVAADQAVRLQKRGRDMLPESMREDFDRVLRAFEQLEAGQDDALRETLQPVGLRSPFLEWKLFLRGLQAYYQQDDARAVENWQRIKPDRLPSRLAAPFWFQINKDFRAAQSPESQAFLQRQVDRLQSAEAINILRELQAKLSTPGPSLAATLRLAEQAKKALEQEAPTLVARLATAMYWVVMSQGQPEDVPRYQRVFGTPPADPTFQRMHALAWDRAGSFDAAHKHWQAYTNEIEKSPALWPGEQNARARALVWQHMGQNAEKIPDDEQVKFLPAFLRNHPDRPRPLDPGAEKCYRQSIALAPDIPETHRLLFRQLNKAKTKTKAIRAGEEMLKRFPDDVPMLTELGHLLSQQERHADAVELFQRALKNNPLDRSLRQEVGAAMLFHARSLAEGGKFDEARTRYQAALDTGGERGAVLCKWAACEFKAGEAERGEELLREALAADGSSLAVSYSMLIEAIRLKLPPALKKRFDKEFKDGVKTPPESRSAARLAAITADHERAGIKYVGQGVHQKAVMGYLKKAEKIDWQEQDLEAVCRALPVLDAYRLSLSYVATGERLFPRSPWFSLLYAEIEVSRGPMMYGGYGLRPALERAQRNADALPPGPRREEVTERLARARELERGIGGLGSIFEQFSDPFGDYEDDWEDEP
jgi:tetratricopeptide (TPR) repeat protein